MDLCGWIFKPVFPQFIMRCCERVNAKLIAKISQVDQDITNLFLHLRQFVRRETTALLLSQPLEVLGQLTYFNDQGHNQIFRGMVLVPVPFPAEMFYLLNQILQSFSMLTEEIKPECGFKAFCGIEFTTYIVFANCPDCSSSFYGCVITIIEGK